jgi:hypothetical protein
MQPRQVIKLIDTLLLVLVFFWVLHWFCRRQRNKKTITRSSAEAELRAMFAMIAEVVWLQWLLEDIGIRILEPTPLYCDNRSAIQIAKNPTKYELNKHIRVDVFFERQHYNTGIIFLHYIPSELQIADLFTKAQTKS